MNAAMALVETQVQYVLQLLLFIFRGRKVYWRLGMGNRNSSEGQEGSQWVVPLLL